MEATDRQFCGMTFGDFSATLSRRWPSKELFIAATDVRLVHSAVLAAKQWDENSGLTLTVRNSSDVHGDADMNLSFESGDHGDGQPLDGPGGVLAHAWYPMQDRDYEWEGQAHFDSTEPWAYRPGEPGLMLDHVVRHEMGHLLGLGHNPSDAESVMYPYYQRAIGKLSRDDIAGIQYLYGPPPLPDPIPGDPFHYSRELTARWSKKDQWLLEALIAGKIKGVEWINYRGRVVPTVLIDSTPPEDE